MRGYVATRVGQAVLVLWAAYTLSFVLLSALPGDAVSNRVQNPEANISPEGAQLLLEYYGLDRPLREQYLDGLTGLLRGDLGVSLTTAQPVQAMLASALPSTLRLTSLALVLGLVLASVVALVINYAPWGWLRELTSSLPALFASVPTFVAGVLALQLLSFRLGLVPSVDDGSFRALLAPAATLALVVAAPLSQVFSSSIRSTRRQPFVHVLHAKGASEGFIFRKDVLRNSSLPVLTLLGLAFGELVAGSVVTESVYARDGIGQLVVGAVSTQDLPVVQGVVVLSTVAYVAINLAVDLAYPYVDPRILVEGTSRRTTALRRQATVAASVVLPEPARRRLPAEVAMP
ncbi:ABC transporter permease [Cellulomonas sp. NPDC055163]